MIFTDRKITIRNGKSTINEPVILYRGDYEVSIKFTIMESKFRFKSGVNLVDSEKASFGQLAILAPYGGNVFSEVVKCEDGTVTFTLTKEMIDQLEEVGLYSFQIRLFDYYRESRVSIPPVEFGIEVREPVASEDHDNKVNNAIVGYSIAKVVDPSKENVGDTFDANGNYNKTDWETGDRITEGKLNKIEDALDKINKNEKNDVAALDNRITSNYSVLDYNKADKNEVNSKVWGMANMGQDVKEAMTGGSVAVVGENAVMDVNVVDNSISRKKLNFYTVVQNNNLYDRNNALIGQSYNNTGSLVTGSSYTYNSTNFLEVEPNTKYYFLKQGSHTAWVVYWDLNKEYISGTTLTSNFTTPNNTKYVTINIYGDYLDSFYVSKDQNNPYGVTVKDEELLIYQNNIADKQVSIDKLDFYTPSILNLYSRSNALIGKTYNNAGALISGYNNTNFIEVKPNTSYATNPQPNGQYTSAYTSFWDGEKNHIEGYNTAGSFTTPDNCYYVTVLIYTQHLDDFYICEEEYRDYPHEPDLHEDPKLIISGTQVYGSVNLGKNSVTTNSIVEGAITPDKTSFVDKVRTVNLLNNDELVWKNGYYNSSGTFVGSSQHYITTVEALPNTTYTFVTIEGLGANYFKNFWDADNKFIKTITGTTTTFTTPENCSYLTLTVDAAGRSKPMLVLGDKAPSYYIDYYEYVLNDSISVIPTKGNVSKLYQKKWGALGDSITNGYGYTPYHSWIAQEYEMDVTNYGISGNRLATDGGPYGVPMCIRYADMDDDLDIITVMGGTNDQSHGVPLGVFSDRTVETFYGGLHVLIQGLIAKYPGKTIAFLTPIQRSGCKDDNGFKAGGLVKYVDAIIEVCGYYSIPCLDLFRHGGIQHDIPSVATVYIKDGTHPTSEGHRDILAGKIRGFLESLL